MGAAAMKSRPTYPGLWPRPGTMHLIVVDEHGVEAALDLAKTTPDTFWTGAHVIFTPSAPAQTMEEKAARRASLAKLLALGARCVHPSAGFAAAVPRIEHVLNHALMGTNLYVAGTEGLIGQTMKLALDVGMELECIVTEHRGSLLRRVQCVHCKGITDNVTTQPVTCAHCRLTLFVRDHYSRRIAAFQGVSIDAEAPGVVPPTEEAFK
jgi:hypothetical protein